METGKTLNPKVGTSVLMIIGLVLISIFYLSIHKSVRIKKLGVTAEGTVLAYNHHRKGLAMVTVSFITRDGNQITAKASKFEYISIGKKVKIWYDPTSPQDISFGDTIRYHRRIAVLGGLLFILGFYLFIKISFRDRANNMLIKTGMKIAADFVSADKDEKFKAGKNNPWVIKCKWTDNTNNKEYYFVSEDYMIDPAPYLEGRYHIDVYIDPADPGKYYVDTSFMPKEILL